MFQSHNIHIVFIINKHPLIAASNKWNGFNVHLYFIKQDDFFFRNIETMIFFLFE